MLKMDGLKYPGAFPYFPKDDRREILSQIEKILISGQMTQGHYLQEFEKLCCEMSGTNYSIGVNSGGTALELVFNALGIRNGEVIVPTETFVATPNSVVRAGGVPVFADISPDNLGLSIESLKACFSPRTRGVALVHMFGIMAEQISEIQKFCNDHGLFLVEDAAHAHGASYKSIPAGSLGVAGCFSYYATKILTTGEGGVITTNNEELAAKIRSLRDHGRTASGSEFNLAGNNFRLAEIPALLGTFQQHRLPEILSHRRNIAKIYREAFNNHRLLKIIDPFPHEEHSYWRYTVLLDHRINRKKIQMLMQERANTRITWMYEPLCHQQPFYKGLGNFGNFLVAMDVSSRLINLPTHLGIDPDGAELITKTLLGILGESVR
jgi:perosamine synthetase